MEGGGDLWQSLGMGPEPLEGLGSLPELTLDADWKDPALAAQQAGLPTLAPPLGMGLPAGLDGGAAALGSGALATAGSGSGSGPVPQPLPQQAQPPQLSKQEMERQRNREKQARFRQRQREKKEQLAQAHEAAAAELERERERGEQLRASAAVLEAVQATKDAALRILGAAGGQQQQQQQGQQAQQQQQQAQLGQQQQQQQQQQQARLQGGWRVTEGESSSPSASSGSQRQAQAVAAAPAEPSTAATGGADDALSARFGGLGGGGAELADRMLALSFTERVEIATGLFRSVKPAQQVLVQAAGRRPDGFALQYEVRREVGQRLLSEVPQLLDVARAMTPEQALREWAEFSDFVAGVVAAVDEGRLDEAAAEKRLAPAVIYQAIQEAILLTHNPSVLRGVVAHSKLPGESEAAAEERWGNLGVDIGFSADQASQAVPIYREYCAQLEQLAGQSAAALDTLRQVQQALSQRLLDLDAGFSAQTLSYLKLFEAAGALEHQPDAALMILSHFYGRIGTLSTPLQKARIISRSGHLHVDVPAMVKGVLAHHGLLPEPDK